LDFDPRDIDSRDREDFDIHDRGWLDDPRDLDDRERDFERDLDPRDCDPREPFIEGLELPYGFERELLAGVLRAPSPVATSPPERASDR
jgi:hypothetical protein